MKQIAILALAGPSEYQLERLLKLFIDLDEDPRYITTVDEDVADLVESIGLTKFVYRHRVGCKPNREMVIWATDWHDCVNRCIAEADCIIVLESYDDLAIEAAISRSEEEGIRIISIPRDEL